MVTVEDIRALTKSLPRSEEHLVRDQVKFRVGRLVYLALSPDETTMGFAYPKEHREALVTAEPHKFHLPRPSDMRYNWVDATLTHLGTEELTELVINAWTMCVPKSVAAAFLDTVSQRRRPGPGTRR
ncbi:MmcQ/YjbR family DNA-binding protein [Kutzneria sp. CA-103260]|uniref:MmcQ/YjbR family DNA-binding protein n=1 Tax=Kutzneria sp. CA-103260 TaxID=2802641 RepID=UPI001BACFD5C|nr:MmcQ/YjbR family DNA-binding protein [Kutzneria sp. CA-103260]QUQ62831.1 MmcQ/YjbR family DNA-binding protein [Kutzneria sp. CA-103260]